MLLAIDVGNTQTVIGLFDNSTLINSWRMVTPRHETSDEIGSSIMGFINNCGYDPAGIDHIVVSCVVPMINEEIKRMGQRYFKSEVFLVDSSINNMGISINYDYPREIGADRIANSVAAVHIYGFPAVVVDFGTATTFDIISSDGEYTGGVIAPGIEISSEALFNYAAKLSKVDLSWPDRVIAKNTYDGIRSGILYGFLGQVDYLLDRILEEQKSSDNDFEPRIIFTGGLAYLMKDRSRYNCRFDPDLTLKGLQIIMAKNL
ncbi:MAG: type III pantothenate kinase [Actinomycetia bacterium]|nr:type III pantothenate kinase [Actinomycetes bacterium]